jgi:hypothetical protein
LGSYLLVSNKKKQSYISGYQKLHRVVEIGTTPFKSKSVGQSIQNYIKRQGSIKSIDELIRLFLNLIETYATETKSISDSYSDLIKVIASRI